MRVVKTKIKVMTTALLALLFLLLMSPYSGEAVDAAWQAAFSLSVRRHYLTWPAIETDYFSLRYPQGHEELALLMGQEADDAVRRVEGLLPHGAGEKRPWLILIPDQQSMQRAFGWSEETGALGVYLADTIKILSPAAWDWYEEDERLEAFVRQGPLIHEYTHFVLDLRTGGNYPRWFSEGLSQLTEYHLLDHEWLEAGSSLARALYSFDHLERSFDALAHQDLAYRQALSMVTYLESLQGMDGINLLLDELAAGVPFYRALQDVYGLDRDSFWEGWQEWHKSDPRWRRVRSSGQK